MAAVGPVITARGGSARAVAAMSSISQQDLDLAIIKLRSSFYDEMSHTFGFGKADMLSCFALFDDDPGRINSIESEFRRITTDVVTKTVREYLRPENRTILIVNPKAPD